ncbi:MAG: C1 family peptidase, partial [Candidatus Thermoplasmatota archaeon]
MKKRKIVSIFVMLVMIGTAVTAIASSGDVFSVQESSDDKIISKTTDEETTYTSDSDTTYTRDTYDDQSGDEITSDDYDDSCKNCGEENNNLKVMSDMPPVTKEDYQMPEYDPNPNLGEGMRTGDDLPSHFSWRDYNGNWMTPAKDQGYCGSCYIFGAWGPFEAAIDIASGDPGTNIDLSEQYGLSCINDRCYGCDGGWGRYMIDNAQSTELGQSGNGVNGITIESCMPYEADDTVPCSDKCNDWDQHTDPPAEDDKLWQIEDWGWTQTSENSESDWQMIKTWLFNRGPLAASIAWDSSLSQWADTHHDPDDVYEQDSSDNTNHLVTLVGWVDDSSILNGGYWIIKNSHGTDCGYNGYVNIAYGCNQVACSECLWVTAESWPEEEGPHPDYDMSVFANFEYSPEYPHVGEEIQFTDTTEGNVAQWEWDFDGDGEVDSMKQNPTWTYNQEGKYSVHLTTWSEFGLSSNITKSVEVKENWPPVAICSPSEYPEEPGDNELEIYFDGRYSYDPDGKINSWHWDFDDGSTAEGRYLWHTFPEPDTIYNVTLTVTDNAGVSGSTNCVVKIDQTVPPVTEAYFSTPGSEWGEWYDSTRGVYLEATDWTSVIHTYYRVDGGEWEEYPSTKEIIRFGEEGVHTLDFYSVDYYRNEENIRTREIKIDKTLPSLDINIDEEKENGWYHHAVTVELTGSDEPSGVDVIKYRINNGEWKTYTDPFTIGSSGTYTVEAYVADQAGNTYSIEPVNIPIEINTDLDAEGSLNWNSVDPGDTVSDSFKVMNVGESGSELHWMIAEHPDWGTWSFSPSFGTDLTPEDGKLTVDVTVNAPDEEDKDFSGEVKVVN